MYSFLINLLSILLTTYITSIIIFKQYYFNITHLVDFLLLTVFMILMVIEKKDKYHINAIIVLYAIFVIISLASSLWGIGFDNPSFKSLQLFIVLINLFVLYNIIKEYNLINYFLNGILLGTFINYLILFGFLNVPFDIYAGAGHGARAMGTMGNPNSLATVMIISIIVSLIYLLKDIKINKYFYYYQTINILVALYVLMLTVSKKGIILGGVLLSAYLLLLIKSKKGLVQLGVMLLLGALIAQFLIDWTEFYATLDSIVRRFTSFSEGLADNAGKNSTTVRKELIEFGLLTFQSNPIFGHGLNNYRLITNGQYAHNTPVELLVGVGLVGTLVFYGMYVYLLKKIYEMKKSNLQYVLYIYLFSMVLMDMATVSYGTKFTLFTILCMSILAESESEIMTLKDDNLEKEN